jgi:hypothetical protein
MARSGPAVFDERAFSSVSGGGGMRPGSTWSCFPVEVDVGEATPLIVSPHLYDVPAMARHTHDTYTCFGAPSVALFCARGLRVGLVRDEIVPRLRRRTRVVVVASPEVAEVTVFSSRPPLTTPLRDLAIVVEELFGASSVRTEHLAEYVQRDARMREGEPEEPFDFGPEAVAAPIRLWEALFWRGVSYRYELVGGEVPLHARLGSAPAAAATVERILLDAEALVREPRRAEAGFWRVGPVRARVHGDEVDLRVRMTPADVRVAFSPVARMAGDDAPPTVLGALMAGGDNGKTEMTDGWTWSTSVHDSEAHARAAGEALEGEISRWTGAHVGWLPELEWPRETSHDPLGWYLRVHGPFLTVYVPFDREWSLPCRVHGGEGDWGRPT